MDDAKIIETIKVWAQKGREMYESNSHDMRISRHNRRLAKERLKVLLKLLLVIEGLKSNILKEEDLIK